MSADNWTCCPKCQEECIEARRKAIAKAEKAYGKVSSEKYLEQMKAAEAMPKEPDTTLREDYGIGIDGGTFSVSYHASCQHCDFEFSFSHEEATP